MERMSLLNALERLCGVGEVGFTLIGITDDGTRMECTLEDTIRHFDLSIPVAMESSDDAIVVYFGHLEFLD
ncbi:hypothetical protein [Dipodfec virus UOA04_Rod_542]|nr:hypothetical protein [Dipodfec virus UOA04_Rod_542]